MPKHHDHFVLSLRSLQVAACWLACQEAIERGQAKDKDNFPSARDLVALKAASRSLFRLMRNITRQRLNARAGRPLVPAAIRPGSIGSSSKAVAHVRSGSGASRVVRF